MWPICCQFLKAWTTGGPSYSSVVHGRIRHAVLSTELKHSICTAIASLVCIFSNQSVELPRNYTGNFCLSLMGSNVNAKCFVCIVQMPTHQLSYLLIPTHLVKVFFFFCCTEIRSSTTFSSFKSSLKTCLFQQSYWLCVCVCVCVCECMRMCVRLAWRLGNLLA